VWTHPCCCVQLLAVRCMPVRCSQAANAALCSDCFAANADALLASGQRGAGNSKCPSWSKRSRPPSALQALSQIEQFTDQEDAASVATTVSLATALMEFVCVRHECIAIPDSRGAVRHRIRHAFTPFITFLTSATHCSLRGGDYRTSHEVQEACRFPRSCGLPAGSRRFSVHCSVPQRPSRTHLTYKHLRL
jgi:hypothetical protein